MTGVLGRDGSDLAEPLLSICIATMNRGGFIGATLKSIVSQATDAVEIVVVDGASTDNTSDVVKSYQERFPRLRYERLAQKGGVDKDYARTIELARGRYCWLFTDDDLLKPGAIERVLAEIRRGHGLILINCDVKNADLSELLEERRVKVETDRVYHSADWEQLFVDATAYLSFIGGVVIKRSVWDARDKASYFGTLFHHVGVIFQAPMADGALLVAAPLISVRYGNALWTARSFQISQFMWPDLVWSFPGYSEAAKRRVTHRTPWDSMTALLIYRARGAFSAKEYRELVEPRLKSPLRRLMARAIAALPGVPLNLGLVAYLSAFGRFYSEPGARLVDLRQSRYYYRRVFRAPAAPPPRRQGDHV